MDKQSRQIDLIWEADLEEPPDLRMAPFFQDLCQCLGLQHVEMSLLVTSDDRIQALNAQYRGKDQPTDVLSFPNGQQPPSGEARHLGDIVISGETASRQAEEIGQSLATELRFLCLHGTLHLMGYDHETDDGTMLRLQSDLKSKLQDYF